MEFIAAALTSASESEQQVTALLYGFDGHRRTPEEVAQQCGLSLPQVVQTAKSALRRMRHPACAPLIREALLSNDERIWSALAGSDGIIYRAERLAKVQACLPGELLFAIECQYGSVENWLSANARVTAKAWYRSRFAAAEIDGLVGKFSTAADEFRLPAPVESLARAMNVEAECLDMAVRLSDVWAVYSGYAVGTPVGTRAPRAVRLHRMLAHAHSGEIVPARRLVSEYRSEFADDLSSLPNFVEIAFRSVLDRVTDLLEGRPGICGSILEPILHELFKLLDGGACEEHREAEVYVADPVFFQRFMPQDLRGNADSYSFFLVDDVQVANTPQ